MSLTGQLNETQSPSTHASISNIRMIDHHPKKELNFPSQQFPNTILIQRN